MEFKKALGGNLPQTPQFIEGLGGSTIKPAQQPHKAQRRTVLGGNDQGTVFTCEIIFKVFDEVGSSDVDQNWREAGSDIIANLHSLEEWIEDSLQVARTSAVDPDEIEDGLTVAGSGNSKQRADLPGVFIADGRAG
ncbi:MAG: hypothetical protein ACOZE5_09160 [Verrucomicrobiota bacterium]